MPSVEFAIGRPDLGAGSWGAQQLAEFLGGMAADADPQEATRLGLERVSELLEADAVCLLRSGVEPLAIGFPLGRVPEALLETLRPGSVAAAELPGLGMCRFAREPLDDERHEWLVVARAGDAFAPAERDLLRGMARVLGLTREMLIRRLLLERVSEIQRQIVRRAPSSEILRLICEGAAELAASEIAVLRESNQEVDGEVQVSVGLEPELRSRSAHHGHAVAEAIRREGRLVVVEDYDQHEGANTVLQADGVRAVMGAPVRDSENQPLGALVVASRGAGRRFSRIEREVLETFAGHASMALIDARMVADAVHRSLHDPLTALPNRSLFANRLEHALARAERSGQSVAVLFLDIDRFKTVNDSLGHNAGDELLIAAARRLEGCIRPGDTVARFGGDEFAVLVEDADESLGTVVAQRILRAFARPFSVAGRPIGLGASIGVAIAERPSDDPLRDGDLAMYRAKGAGRGRVQIFRPEMRAAAQERLELETALRGAARRGELFAEYQPIVDMNSGRPMIVEALVRWNHPTLGRLEPAAFLPLAEDIGEIDRLGRWLLESACRQLARWRAWSGGQDLAIAVNLSPRQLAAPDLLADVQRALRASGLPPEALVLELTETTIMADYATAAERLRSLKELGVRIAIDDFGTGYCSLQHLQEFPIDFLKIARPFVAELNEHDDANLGLVRTIIDLGESCGLSVIAEGIETESQRRRLRSLGCAQGQGFLFARPRSADDLDLAAA